MSSKPDSFSALKTLAKVRLTNGLLIFNVAKQNTPNLMRNCYAQKKEEGERQGSTSDSTTVIYSNNRYRRRGLRGAKSESGFYSRRPWRYWLTLACNLHFLNLITIISCKLKFVCFFLFVQVKPSGLSRNFYQSTVSESLCSQKSSLWKLFSCLRGSRNLLISRL